MAEGTVDELRAEVLISTRGDVEDPVTFSAECWCLSKEASHGAKSVANSRCQEPHIPGFGCRRHVPCGTSGMVRRRKVCALGVDFVLGSRSCPAAGSDGRCPQRPNRRWSAHPAAPSSREGLSETASTIYEIGNGAGSLVGSLSPAAQRAYMEVTVLSARGGIVQ